ncbi:MAG: Sulfate adenylyltransferase subunit 1 / Adenylylsulfate kinase, partial [uncultured Acidimicrobiales bacterium]
GRGRARRQRSSPPPHLAPRRAVEGAALGDARHPGRHHLVHGALRIRQVDRRCERRAAPGGGWAAGVDARRGQRAPRPERRPRVLRRGPHGERPAGGGGGPAPGRRRCRGPRPRHQPVPCRAGRSPGCPRGGGTRLPRGVRGHAPRDVRGAGPQGPLRQGPEGRARRHDGRRQPVRGSSWAGPRPAAGGRPRRGPGRAGAGALARRGARAV